MAEILQDADAWIDNQIEELLERYNSQGGSETYNMGQFRQAFSEIIPFEDPLFLHVFSVTARRAINYDRARNRFCYPVGHFPPPAGVPLQFTVPYVLPEPIVQPDNNQFQNQNFPDFHHQQHQHQHQQNQQQQHHQNQQREGIQDFNQLYQYNQQQQQQDMVFGRQERARQDQQIAPEPTPRRRRRHDSTSEVEGANKRRKHKKRKSKHNRERSVSHGFNSSSDSSGSDTDELFTFQKADKESGKKLSKEAIEIRETVDEYRKRGIKTAKVAFGRLDGKEPNFPESLYSDLLQYQYVDLEKVVAEIHSQSTHQREENQVLKINTRTQSIETSTKTHKRFPSNSGEWRRAVGVLRKVMSLAFPCAKPSFKAYFRHVKDMEATFEKWGNWKEVVSYDADMRRELAKRTHLSFADFNHEELLFVRTRKPPTSDHQNHARPSSSSFKSGTYHPNPSRTEKQTSKPTKSPWAGQIKRYPQDLNIKEQLCGKWNLDRCNNDDCVRIHGKCDFIGCSGAHRRVTHHPPGDKK